MMNGTIGLESEPGVGSVFWCTLSLRKPKAIVSEPALVRKGLAGRSILIVDDNSTSRTMLTHQCERWGMVPVAAGTAEEAAGELLRGAQVGKPYDVALLDMQMPGKDGLTLARELRQRPEVLQTALILMPSLGQTVNWSGEKNLAGFLTKPVKESALYDTLVRVWGNDGVAQVHQPALDSMKEQSRKGLAILVAEDNAVNQKVAVRMLEKLGYVAEIAPNGRLAVEAVQAKTYDVVFMDCNMPEMDGYEATREIRALRKGRPGPIIIAMTANALNGDREKALESGMDDYLTKPINAAELEGALERWSARMTAPPLQADQGLQQKEKLQLLDNSRIEELRALGDDGDPEWLRGLIEQYLQDTRMRLAELKEALASLQATAVKNLAHIIKGSSNNIGAVVVGGHAQRMQHLGEQGTLGEAAEIFDDLAASFEETSAAMERQFLVQEGSK
jgi:two-component system, sensor histidine kinase and response regulator